MKDLRLFCLLVLFGIPFLCRADWMSEVDKRYQTQFPSQYAKVSEAQKLITNAQGNTSHTRRAIELLRSVISVNQRFAPAYVQIARATSNLGLMQNNRFDLGSLQEMEKALRKALEIEPSYDYAIALMGFAKMFQGDLDGAEKYYGQAERMGSTYPYLLTQQSQLANRRGNYKLALDYATKAYEQNRNSPTLAASAINEILFTLQKMPDDTSVEEEKWYTKRRELVPTAWNWQAHASFRLYRFGDYEKSIEYGKNALTLMDFGVGRYTLAAAYYKKWSDLRDSPSRANEAKQAYQAATMLYPVTDDMLADFDRNNALRSTAGALRKKAANMDVN